MTRDGRAETYRLGAGSSPFVRQETWVTGPNLRKCRRSYTASPRYDSGWLGLKDSNLDFQNQNLTSYQLDEAPPRCVFQRRQLNTRPAGRLDRSRKGTLEIVRSCHDRIVAHARRRLEAPMHLFPRGLGSASEAHCPARLGSGGALLSQSCRNRGNCRV